jgi:hypothetical protein
MERMSSEVRTLNEISMTSERRGCAMSMVVWTFVGRWAMRCEEGMHARPVLMKADGVVSRGQVLVSSKQASRSVTTSLELNF